eukprot:gb/GFBE01016021.1/.p1 GENE.gb/GFBE01016021.1/~~gb/GFBE01016021.1/.p1  ORF type:complete len:147 (+),score=22.91 gb/GFBE01016021.1/:1-441(+)
MGCGCSQSQVAPLAPREFLPVVPGAGRLEKRGTREGGDEDGRTQSEQRAVDAFNTQQSISKRVEAPNNLVAFRSMKCDPSPEEVSQLSHPFPSCLPLHKAKINRLERHLVRWRKDPSTFAEKVIVRRNVFEARCRQKEAEHSAQQP